MMSDHFQIEDRCIVQPTGDDTIRVDVQVEVCCSGVKLDLESEDRRRLMVLSHTCTAVDRGRKSCLFLVPSIRRRQLLRFSSQRSLVLDEGTASQKHAGGRRACFHSYNSHPLKLGTNDS